MSEPEQSSTPSPGEAAPSRWRRWFTPTGAPPAWALAGYLVCGLVVGAALAAPLPQVRGTLLAALTGGIVAASGSGGPSGIARRVALVTAGTGLVLTVVAFATGYDPVWAAIAMAAVAILTTVVTVCSAHHIPIPTFGYSSRSSTEMSAPAPTTTTVVAVTITPAAPRTYGGSRRNRVTRSSMTWTDSWNGASFVRCEAARGVSRARAP